MGERDERDAAAVAVADAAYQGRPGAYSEGAARRLCGDGARLLPCDTLRDVFQALAEGRARSAVVPVENSLAGAVPGALGLLLESGAEVHGEAIERIDHVLAAPEAADVEGLREVLSHPVALAQCEGFFRRRPALRPVPVFDTAGALELLSAERDPTRAAIVSRAAAALHDAVVLAEHIQDHPDNFTRFFHVGPAPAPRPAAGACRVVLAVRVAHQPGALAALLQSVAAAGVNLTRIDCWPVRERPFEYEFLLEGIVEAAGVDALVDHLSRGARVRLLGAVPHQPPG